MDFNNFKKFIPLKKNDSDDIFKIEGVATVYDEIDKTEEIIKDGAFDDDINKVVPIQVMHRGVESTIGTAKLSRIGKSIIMSGRLFEESEMGKTIAMAKADGVIYNLSIGGKRTDYGWEEINKKDVFITKKGKINEVSITGEDQQAHPNAIVTKKLKEKEEEQMEKELDYTKLAKELAKEMDKAEDGQKSNDELKKLQEEVKVLKESLIKAESGDSKIEELEKVINKMDETINELSEPGNFEGGINKSLQKEMDNFEKALRETDGADFQKALDTTGGAALIPELLANDILKDLKESNAFYKTAKVYKGTGKSLEIPIRDSWANTVEGVAEGAGVVTKGTLTYSRVTIEANYLQSEIELTDEMRQDTDFNVQSEIREAAVEDFDEHLSQNIVDGVVSATQKFEGFTVNAALQASALETAASLTVTLDDLMDLPMELKKKDRMNGAYYVSKDIIKDMKKYKSTTGDYLWKRGSQITGTPDTFDGYPVYETEFMKNKTAGNWVAGDYPVLFANFSKLYAIYEKVGMETEMDRKASERIWNHITRMRTGGKVIRPWAGRLLKIKL